MIRQYEFHQSRLRFIESVRSARVPLLAALLWLPIRLRFIRWKPPIFTRPESVADALVPVHDLPQSMRSAMHAVIDQLAGTDYVDPIIELQESTGCPGEETVTVVLRARHRNGQQLFHSAISVDDNSHRVSETLLMTFFPDSRTIGTSDGRKTLDRAPGASATYHPSATLEQLESFHSRKLQERFEQPILLQSTTDVIREIDSLMDRYFQHMTERGVLTECDTQA